MCTVLLAYRHLPDAPVVMAANRDEFADRSSVGPGILHERPRIAGGRDATTGGTWLAVAADGRVATVTNRLCESVDSTRKSRGELPVALLLSGHKPADWIAGLQSERYNPFNILFVSPDEALVGHAVGSGPIDLVPLGPGLHILTLCDVNRADDAKVSFLAGALGAAAASSPDADSLLAAMEDLLGEHGDDTRNDLDATCVHGPGYGTVSSSSVVVRTSGEVTYRHAPGPPCQTPRRDVSHLLRDAAEASLVP